MTNKGMENIKREEKKILKDLNRDVVVTMTNFQTVTSKHRGDENLDVHMYVESDTTYDTDKVINMYIADGNTRYFGKYIVKDGEIINKQKKYGNGHKRVQA